MEWPSLYRLDTTVTLSSSSSSGVGGGVGGGLVADASSTVLGVRRLGWTAEDGFFLNDQPVKIKVKDEARAHALSSLEFVLKVSPSTQPTLRSSRLRFFVLFAGSTLCVLLRALLLACYRFRPGLPPACIRDVPTTRTLRA